MDLKPESRLGHFEIVSLLGRGGMGEVWQARDTKLGRDVAIKVLPEAFAGDKDRLSRFEREAKILASLDHPNIATIHELCEEDGAPFLVLQLIEGRTLADRIAAGSIKVEDALPIFAQIAEALESAHEHGIVHRDLKPANVKVTEDGNVKVLDFGLAKALRVPADLLDASEAPTVDPDLTIRLTILGTPAYMSPEQARGQTVDKRTDIWAFGCCLYEALTRERPFHGESTSDVLAKLLETEPDWEALPPGTPFRVRDMLWRCLQKDLRLRLRDIGEALFAIGQAQHDSSPPSIAARSQSSEATRAEPRAVKRYSINLPSTEPFVRGLALSPDGTLLVYVSKVDGREMLVSRRMDRLEVQPMPGTEDARSPFFSPDGQWVGFITEPERKLKKVSIQGGESIVLCADHPAWTASWGQDDFIVFSTESGPILYRVSAAGGAPEILSTLDSDAGETFQNFPNVLPGKKGLLFATGTGPLIDRRQSRVVLASMGGSEHRVIDEAATHPHYVPSGHVVYSQLGRLTARSFDLGRLEVTGPSVSVTESRMASPETYPTQYAFSKYGTLVYAPTFSKQSGNRALVWVDREGNEEMLAVPMRPYDFVRLSPDRSRIVCSFDGPTGRNVWIYDLGRGTLQRLTFDSASNFMPAWTPDGQRVVFSSILESRLDLFWKAADGTGSAERLVTSPNRKYPWQFTSDGQFLIYLEFTPGAESSNIAVLSMEGERSSRVLLHSRFDELHPILSPDERWIAYTTNESGRDEVYVLPFPDLGGRWQVSTGGGTRPLWARNGKELFYLRGNEMMAVPIETEPSFTPGAPRVLFEREYFMSVRGMRVYDVSGDDNRFLMIKKGEGIDETSPQTELIVVENWFEELKRLVPVEGN